MREFKFRAWHKDVNAMQTESSTGKVFSWLSENQQIEIMQFTGLKDEYGKEIYEGDIVTTDSYFWANRFEDGIVKYDENMAMFVVDFIEQDIKPLAHVIHFSSVKGNIYQNPEMIEVTLKP